MQVAVREAKAKLSRFGDMAHDGEVVVVCKNGEPWFDMVPHAKIRRRTAPLSGVTSLISESESTKPLNPEDVPGWS
jgi:antitoxin (DNA-binding transcriptional repressor) of toxin-antitoxin stability system